MLYPRKEEPALSKELFENPDSVYRGCPFWSWNCRITKELIADQIDMFEKMGVGGVTIHPRTGLDTPYLSDEFMEYIRYADDILKSKNMLCWLYDEDRYPSGAAGGIVTENLEFRSRHIVLTQELKEEFADDLSDFQKEVHIGRKPKGYYLTSYHIRLTKGYLAEYRQVNKEFTAATGSIWHAYVRLMEESPWFNDQTYIDVLNQKAVEKFIEVTYERYKEVMGSEFGSSIPAIFTDEPHMKGNFALPTPDTTGDATIPYTDDLDETYHAAYGCSLLDVLPEILWELPEPQISIHRYQFRNHLSDRFANAYSDTIGAWCEKNQIAFTGHYLSERSLYSQTLALGGETMRLYRGHQLPGIDILADQKEFSTAKQAVSVARQYAREGVLSELYGVTHWDFDFKGHKLQGDWQAALGITVRVHHLAYMSMEGEAKRDWPAAISYQSPWYDQYSYIEDHFSRVYTALTRGQAIVKVGVICPIESFWIKYGPNSQTQTARDQLDENYENLMRWLLYGAIDFDLISESLLPELCTDPGFPLKVGAMQYDTILLPAMLTIRSTTLERLEGFVKAGGKVIIAGNIPELVDAAYSDRPKQLASKAMVIPYNRNQMLEALSSDRTVEIRNCANGKFSDNLIYQMRQDGEDRFLFICHVNRKSNKLDEVEKYRIILKGNWKLTLYQTLTGEILPVAASLIDGNTEYLWEAYSQDSLLLRMEPDVNLKTTVNLNTAVNLKTAEPVKVVEIETPDGFILDEPNVLLLDYCEYALDDQDWQKKSYILNVDNELRKILQLPMRQDAVTQPWRLKEEPFIHTAHLRYQFFSGLSIDSAMLAMERPEQATIHLNGNLVETTPTGWFVDKFIKTISLKDIVEGVNVLELDIPFGRRSNLECLYLLGDFGVECHGSKSELIKAPKKLEFGDITSQKLCFYAGNIRYQIKQEIIDENQSFVLEIPRFACPVIEVFLDGTRVGLIAFAPHRIALGKLTAGEHTIELKAYGNRYNSFGTLHNCNSEYVWYGPDSYRTSGSEWTDTYLFHEFGILSSVKLLFYKL